MIFKMLFSMCKHMSIKVWRKVGVDICLHFFTMCRNPVTSRYSNRFFSFLDFLSYLGLKILCVLWKRLILINLGYSHFFHSFIHWFIHCFYRGNIFPRKVKFCKLMDLIAMCCSFFVILFLHWSTIATKYLCKFLKGCAQWFRRYIIFCRNELINLSRYEFLLFFCDSFFILIYYSL